MTPRMLEAVFRALKDAVGSGTDPETTATCLTFVFSYALAGYSPIIPMIYESNLAVLVDE